MVTGKYTPLLTRGMLLLCLSATPLRGFSQVIYFPMNQRAWNGTPGEVIDYSGNANHGQAVHGASTIFSEQGIHGQFNGTDYITVSDSPALQITNDMTLSFWIMFTNAPSGGHLVSKNDGNGEYDVYIYADRRMVFWQGSPDDNQWFNIIDSRILPLNAWHHIAVVRTSANSSIRCFVNGKQIYSHNYSAKATRRPTASAVPLKIGSGLQGYLDEFMIDNCDWPETEIQAIAANKLGVEAYRPVHVEEDTGISNAVPDETTGMPAGDEPDTNPDSAP